MFMDSNVTLIDECVQADQAKCSGQCKWRKGKDVAANNDLIKGADLFGANFCHPPTTDNWDQQIGQCISAASKDACSQAKCQWSTGKEFITDKAFCVPRTIPDNAAAFSKCTNMKEETTCVDPTCQWFTPAATGTDPSTPTTQVGRCKSRFAPVAGTADVCSPIAVKDACSNLADCEWTYAPIAVDPTAACTYPVNFNPPASMKC
jgi:hypothetical protein